MRLVWILVTGRRRSLTRDVAIQRTARLTHSFVPAYFASLPAVAAVFPRLSQ